MQLELAYRTSLFYHTVERENETHCKQILKLIWSWSIINFYAYYEIDSALKLKRPKSMRSQSIKNSLSI